MLFKLKDEFVEADRIFGPLPNFNDASFEKFFIQKVINTIFRQDDEKSCCSKQDKLPRRLTCEENGKLTDNDDDENEYNDDQDENETYDEENVKFVSISDMEDLNWMYDVELADNTANQNMEIIFNNNKIYFKSIKTIHQGEIIKAFPSKDLEISLGLQFIPNRSDENYSCKKCQQNFNYQYHLMLHMRYFCSFNTNNLLKTMMSKTNSFNNDIRRPNGNMTHLDVNSPKNVKRKVGYGENEVIQAKKKLGEKKLLVPNQHVLPNKTIQFVNEMNEQENMYTNYFRKLISNVSEQNNDTSNLLKKILNNNMSSTNEHFLAPSLSSPSSSTSASASNEVANLLKLFSTKNQNQFSMNPYSADQQTNFMQTFYQFYQNTPPLAALNIDQHQQNEQFSKLISSYLSMQSKLLMNESSQTSQFVQYPTQPTPFYPANASSLINPIPVMTPSHKILVNHHLKKNPKVPDAQPNPNLGQFICKETKVKEPKPVIPVVTNSAYDEGAKQSTSFPTEFNTYLNSQTLQNWCAKCNTHFRLTSDLVYHMRTFHRKEDPTSLVNSSKSSKSELNEANNSFIDVDGVELEVMSPQISDDKISSLLYNSSKRDMKYLRCEICNELFKEKHHLRRHLTSHR